MKTFITASLIFLSTLAYGQTLSLENPTYRSGDIEYTLSSITDFYTYVDFKRFDGDVLIETGTYRNDKPHGTWIMYSPDGEVKSTMKFNDGNRVYMQTTQEGRKVTILYHNNKPAEVTYYVAAINGTR